MKSVLYDLVTGCAIIMSLFVITAVMRANQNFIVSSTNAETSVEQVYYESDDAAEKENTYTIADVYGTFRNFVKLDGTLMEKTGFKINLGSGYNVVLADRSINGIPEEQAVANFDNMLLNFMNNRPNARFKRNKLNNYERDYVVYEFRYAP